MRFHPVQTNVDALEKIAKIFRDKMDTLGILPKDPWRAKKAEAWLVKMGARMKPGNRHYDVFRGIVDCSNFVNFKVSCPPAKTRIRGERGTHFMRIEIPHDLADKVLTLGYLP